MLKIRNAGFGFYLLIISFVFGVLGFVYYKMTYSVFRYSDDRWAVTMTILSLWFTLFMIVDTLFIGKNPLFSRAFYALAVFMLTYSLLRLLTPCLSPIGIYFTVGNMGDVETNNKAVPLCIIASIFYLVSILTLFAGGILGTTRKEFKES